MSDADKLQRRRTATWLELSDSAMSQQEIGALLGLSQPTVSRAIGIAEGKIDGQYTDGMNGAIDDYIISRDLKQAKLARERREEAKRAAAERIRREEEEARREALWEWIDHYLSPPEQDDILHTYEQAHNPLQPLTPDEELAVIARHLAGRWDPPVEITMSPPTPTPTMPPVQPKPVARTEESPRESVVTTLPRTSKAPVRRNTGSPRRSSRSSVRSKRHTSSRSGMGFRRFIVCGVVLLVVLAIVAVIVVPASIDTVRQLWDSSGAVPYWVTAMVLGVSSCVYLIVSAKREDPEKVTVASWIMKVAAFVVLIFSAIIVAFLLFGTVDASRLDRYLP